MNKIFEKFYALFLLAVLAATPLAGQNFPYGVNYQAVVRDANGSAKTNTTVGVRLSIIKGSAVGATVYVETQSTITNSMGQFNIVVGNGTPVLGTFSLIAWHTDIYFLKSEIQTGPTTYSTIGTQQLMAVPYALHSRSIPPAVIRYTTGAGNYTPSPGVSFIRVRMVGGGGGASNSSATGNGGAGNATSFGTNLLIAGGGNGANYGSAVATGGSYTINAPAVNVASMNGGDGNTAPYMGSTGANVAVHGSAGGSSYFGGAGGTGNNVTPCTNAKVNSGSGGGGSGCCANNGTFGAGSGAAGAYVEAIISGPFSTYTYSIGTGGTGAGAGNSKGGDGGSGIIIIEENY